MNKENEKKRKVRLVPLSSDATLSQRTVIEMFSGSGSTPEKASTPVGVGDEGSTKESASAWSSPLVEKPTSAEETVKAASSTEKSNTAPGTPSQNPPKSSDNGSTSEWRPGKNYERNQRRKQRKKLLKGLKGLDLNNPGGDFQASNSGSTKRPRESSGSLTIPTNPKQKRGRIESEHVEQRGTKRAEEAGPSNLASYARAVKTSNQKLVITRKGSKGEAPMVESDLRVIQGAINQMILKTKLDFSVRIERTFIHSGRVLMICYDEKSLEWAQEIVRAIAPTSVDHQGYEARGPKDAIKSETFGIWLPDNEGLEIKNVLELVDRCNPEIHLKDIRNKYKSKGSGGMLHVVAVQEPSLQSLEELEWAPFAGFRRVQFQKQINKRRTTGPEALKEVQMDTEVPGNTGGGNVSDASDGAEEPKNPNEGSKATSPK